MRSSIQTTGAFRGTEEVGATYLGAGQGGLPIRLADVASVRRRLADAEVRVRAQGASAVGIAVEMLPDRNAIELGQHVQRLLDTLDLPAGNPLSFMAFLGMISLTGIAVNDSIVLVDTVNRLRGEGAPLRDAVVSGTLTRLRAVLLTSITTIGGLLLLSLSGGEFWAPFGFSMIFGLAASTLLTLVVQPAAYFTLERWRSVSDRA